jgi:hypothetical protein
LVLADGPPEVGGKVRQDAVDLDAYATWLRWEINTAMQVRAQVVLIHMDSQGTNSFSWARDVTDDDVSRLKTKVAAKMPIQTWVPRSRIISTQQALAEL